MTPKTRKIKARVLFHCGPLHDDQFERRFYATRASEKETAVAVIDLTDTEALVESMAASGYESANPSRKWANASDVAKIYCYSITRAMLRSLGIPASKRRKDGRAG